jgi:hypothetical protein
MLRQNAEGGDVARSINLTGAQQTDRLSREPRNVKVALRLVEPFGDAVANIVDISIERTAHQVDQHRGIRAVGAPHVEVGDRGDWFAPVPGAPFKPKFGRLMRNSSCREERGAGRRRLVSDKQAATESSTADLVAKGVENDRADALMAPGRVDHQAAFWLLIAWQVAESDQLPALTDENIFIIGRRGGDLREKERQVDRFSGIARFEQVAKIGRLAIGEALTAFDFPNQTNELLACR